MQDLVQIITKFNQVVSSKFCHALARQVGLIKRFDSKIKGYELAHAMMTPNAFIANETLHSLSVRMNKINKRCDISASALAQRMNTAAAVTFMKKCFEHLLKEYIHIEFSQLDDLKTLKIFNRV